VAIAALLAGAGLATPGAPAYAAGDLMVTPTRVVLNNSQRSTVLSIVNTGTEATTYRISLVFRRMTESGELETITTPGPAEELAAHLVRYSPREVTLAPGVTQNVRVQIRKPADHAAGEYRVHMLFLEVPSAETAGTSVSGLNGQKPADVAVKLTQIYGVSIPLIVRHGETTASVALRDLQLQPPAKEGAPPTLSLDVQRTGNRSVYGECAATFIGRDGVEKPLGALRNVAVYTPLAHRTMRMALDVPSGLALRQGRVRLTFKETSPPSDKPLAQAELTLP
jgi:P pilus assembly chaperone PapD